MSLLLSTIERWIDLGRRWRSPVPPLSLDCREKNHSISLLQQCVHQSSPIFTNLHQISPIFINMVQPKFGAPNEFNNRRHGFPQRPMSRPTSPSPGAAGALRPRAGAPALGTAAAEGGGGVAGA